MTREWVGLEVDFTGVDINSSYATHSRLRNKPQIPDSVKENNLSLMQSGNYTNVDGCSHSFESALTT